jgi:hypothetical protein
MGFFDNFGGDIISGGLGFIGGILGNNSASKEASLNRDFQERMARNAYQYAVEDLRKAGLNPALAYQQGGASTPSGSTANVKNPFDSAMAMIQLQKMRQEVNTAKAQEKLTKAQEKRVDYLYKLEGDKIKADTKYGNIYKVVEDILGPAGLGVIGAGAVGGGTAKYMLERSDKNKAQGVSRDSQGTSKIHKMKIIKYKKK